MRLEREILNLENDENIKYLEAQVTIIVEEAQLSSEKSEDTGENFSKRAELFEERMNEWTRYGEGYNRKKDIALQLSTSNADSLKKSLMLQKQRCKFFVKALQKSS